MNNNTTLRKIKNFAILLTLGTVALAVILGIGYLAVRKSGMWEKVSTIGMDKAELVQQFNIPASGWNLRGYEFALPSDPNIHCVFVAGSQKGGLDCFTVTQGE